jgi:hypothetical protein
MRLLALVRAFAGRAQLQVVDVFGNPAALQAGVTPAQRAAAFRAEMLEAGTNPLNDGRTAICCMRQQSNSLFSAAALAAASLTPRMVRDPLDRRLRAPRCDEAVSLFWRGAAQLGRTSDPLLVERLGQLALEGHAVALDSPVGIFIQSVAIKRLRTPDGAVVGQDWLRFSRGNIGPDGRSRFQRLSFQAPPRSDYCVSDLIDVATERPIAFGGEIADLLSLAVYFRVSRPGTVRPPRHPVAVRPTTDTGCKQLWATYHAFQEAQLR